MPSPYGPPVYVPNEVGSILGNAIMNATTNFINRRRQTRLDQQQDLANKASMYEQGVRSGRAPQEYRTDTLPATPSFATPSSADLAQQLRTAPASRAPAAPAQPFSAPSGPQLSQFLMDVPSTRPAAAGGAITPQGRTADGRDTAATHPGAFDIATRQFGGSPLQFATAAAHTQGAPGATPAAGSGGQAIQMPIDSGRYAQLDDSHYIDTTMTPAAVAERTRLQEQQQSAEFAEMLKQTDPLYRAQIEKANEDAADKRAHAGANRRAFGTLQRIAPTNALAQGDYDEGTDYIGEVRNAQAESMRQSQTHRKNLGDYNALKGEFPTHALAVQPFDENTDYAAVLAAERQNKGLVAAADRQGKALAAAATRAGGAGGAGGFGSGGLPAAGRAIASIGSMGVASAAMKDYEQQVLAGKAKFDGLDQFQARLAGHFDKNGVVDDAVFSAAVADLNKRNPDLANYLQNEYLWALEDSNLSGRPSDFRTKMDTFVSSMKANPSQKVMESIWAGRDARLQGYQKVVPAIQARLDRIAGTASSGSGDTDASTATGGRGGGGSTHEQQLWDAAVKKHGRAKVLKEYGPRPQ